MEKSFQQILNETITYTPCQQSVSGWTESLPCRVSFDHLLLRPSRNTVKSKRVFGVYGYQNAKPQQSENLSEATRQKSSKMPSSSGKNLTSMNFLTKEELSAVTWFASQGCSGLRENFSRGALKAEFRRLSKKLHPDTNYGKSPSARAFYELMQSVKILEELALKLDA